jgi:hypothetical protein
MTCGRWWDGGTALFAIDCGQGGAGNVSAVGLRLRAVLTRTAMNDFHG